MKLAILPPDIADKPHQLPFFLAMEEWLAASGHGDWFVMWQVGPTVIFGRNQVIGAEVDTDFCHRRGIEFYRRKSGGGAVYADRQNIMLARVTDSENVEKTFAEFCGMVAGALRSLGLDAEVSGRNDIAVGGRKISGNAFMLLPGGRAIIHGTLLYDTDPEAMEGALTPSAEKLAAKGVASVRSHVTTIREHLPGVSIEQVKKHLVDTLTDGCTTLTAAQADEIAALAAPYYEPSWIFDARTPGHARRRRIEGAGEFAIETTLDADGLIADIDLRGDYMPMGDVRAALITPLVGLPLTRQALETALCGTDASATIKGLSTTEFINLLIPNQ